VDDCRRLVVSPHLDDGALSCGGAVAAWAEAGEAPVVVTVFAGRPPGPLTDFARFQHQRWGETGDLVGLRRQEDERAMAVLGARPCWLDYPDCIYRGDRYADEAALFGRVAAAEAGLAARVADDLHALWRDTAAATLYLPLGLGHHVDHQITREAGRLLHERGLAVAWYEDFPYAIRPGGVAQRRALTRELAPEVIDIAAVFARKCQAVACYASQLPVLFGAVTAMPAAVRDYAAVVGEGALAERVWHLPPLPDRIDGGRAG
jgi:LmbE family N-acetylglucosaminyl deacetylase